MKKHKVVEQLGHKNLDILTIFSRLISLPVKWFHSIRHSPTFRKKIPGLWVIVVYVILIVISFYLALTFRNKIEPFFLDKNNLDSLKTLFITLGSVLFGAAAIVFSLIIFAMQVNLERLPIGLFRKFASDRKLFIILCSTFFLSILIMTFSLFLNRSSVTSYIIIISIYMVLSIFYIFYKAYRRVLKLINPKEQLDEIVKSTRKNLQNWDIKAGLSKNDVPQNQIDNIQSSSHDLNRLAFFSSHPEWTGEARNAIDYSISFVCQYAEKGDYEVVEIALDAIVNINDAYIQAKGKTFFSTNGLSLTPLNYDLFIDYTLEILRRNVLIGISRGDERHITEIYIALQKVFQNLLKIDYSTERASNTYADIAVGYLAESIIDVIPHNMPNVVLDGTRRLSETAKFMINQTDIDRITIEIIINKITSIIDRMLKKEQYQAVILDGVKQLKDVTLALIVSKHRDNDYLFQVIREKISVLTIRSLQTSDPSILYYYYSFNLDCLPSGLSLLVNKLVGAKEDNEFAKVITDHISQWADGLFLPMEDIFLTAIKYRSSYTFEICTWIFTVTKILCVASNAPACEDMTKESLRKSALKLILRVSSIPDDEKTIDFIENKSQITKEIFEMAKFAHDCSCEDISEEVRKILLSWTFKAGKYLNNHGILGNACFYLAKLDIMWRKNESSLINEVKSRLKEENAPGQEVCFYAYKRLNEHLRRIKNWTSLSPVDELYQMNKDDKTKLTLLVQEIAEILKLRES